MTPYQRLKVFCHRICVLLWGELTASARTVRGYWWLYLAMVVAIFSWIGWMHERTDKLERLELLQQELHDYRERSTQIKNQIFSAVAENHESLQKLLNAQRVGPRHTACDTKQILADMRAQGIKLPRYPVEERCK